MGLIDQLKRHEGLELKPYRDTMGLLTIGYGRNLDGKGISQVEAEALLANDVLETIKACENTWPWYLQLNLARANVIANMVFNMGLNKVLQFERTLAAVEAGDYESAARYMLESKWATQVGHRAKELSEQMRTGVEL